MAHNFTHFQAYDVLEPVKAPINPHRDVGVLINFNDEEGKQNCLDLHGSELDNIKKAEFDLVDLYENIYVTPHHVRKQDKVMEFPHMDYSDYFQRLGPEDKVNQTRSSTVLKHPPLNSMTREIDGRSKELPIDNAKTIEKSSFNQSLLDNYEIDRVLKVPIVNDLKFEIDHNDIQNENSIGCNIINRLDNNKANTCEIQKPENDNIANSVSTGTTGTNLIDSLLKNNTASMLDKPFQNINLNKTLLELSFQNRIVPKNFGTANVCNNQLKTNTETLKTVTLDRKTYAKQRQLKREMEKVGYTKGPDLHEKSVVIPQIMKRLDDRMEALQEEAKLRRRLILGSSELNTECQCQCPHKMVPAKPITETKKAKELPQNKSLQASIQSTSSKIETASGKCTANGIRLNPIVALEDCNRERMVAYRVHSAFQKFVLTGSYY